MTAEFDPSLFGGLLAGCAALMMLERAGAPVVLSLDFKGDVKRETRWIAQYGQGACTLVAALIVWRLDPRGMAVSNPLFMAPLAAGIIGAIVKRLFGRVRPGHPRAGEFLGITWKHANFRESFPSNHSATAMALSYGLAGLYPRAALIFWSLAIACAVLRYIMDAHWPSDVLGGLAMGYLVAFAVWRIYPAVA